MKKCKYCKSEINNNEKICPNCYGKQEYPIWIIILAVLLFIGISGFLAQNNKEDEYSFEKANCLDQGKCWSNNSCGHCITDNDESTDLEDSTVEQTQESVDTKIETETVSQKNAVRMAKTYLETLAFSRTGLIKQLEYEGFSTDDATYGVDKLNIDWNLQAAKSAKNYLDTMAFSRTGLINQLEYEGFSRSEAEYGVNSVGL